MNKILIISGPTATGKTALAVSVIKKTGGEIISADSRQIYKEMDIGVGKDHPSDIPVHLIDLISPKQTFSASEYQQLALDKIIQLHSQNKLPIIVGGTGFYIDSIINGQKYDKFSNRGSFPIGAILSILPVRLLQVLLSLLNPKTYKQLNQSDINNPRRLSRKIELSIFRQSLPSNPISIPKYDILHISLTAPNEFIYKRIDQRVKDRLQMGHLNELSALLKKHSWNSPGLKVSCYRHFKKYLDGSEKLDSVVSKWQFSEHRDARHQKTWFKRYHDATFVDISLPSSLSKIRKDIYRWYNNK